MTELLQHKPPAPNAARSLSVVSHTGSTAGTRPAGTAIANDPAC